jgi:hypothetical protein
MAGIPGSRRGPIRYELRLQGHLDQHWSTWFTGLTLTQNPDGTTSLCGTLEDQAELHGLLAKVRDLGATLLSVTSVPGRANCTEPAAAGTDRPDPTDQQGQPGKSEPSPEAAEPVGPSHPDSGETP